MEKYSGSPNAQGLASFAAPEITPGQVPRTTTTGTKFMAKPSVSSSYNSSDL